MLAGILIGTLCSTSPNVNYNACDAASNAYMKQTSWEHNLTLVDDYVNLHALKVARSVENITGRNIWTILGVSYKIYHDQYVNYTLNANQIYGLPSLTPCYNFNSTYDLQINWRTSF